jgi:Tfp pilus assembly protein PilN
MIKINLLPRERISRRVVAPRILVGFVSVVVVAGLVLATIALNVRNAVLQAEIGRVNARIEELKPQVAEVEALQRQVVAARRKEQLLRQLQNLRIPWERVLSELRKILPTDVWLTHLAARNDGTLSFEGIGLSYESVARFAVSLKASPVFLSPEIRVAQTAGVAGHDVISFAVEARLGPVQKAAAIP